MVAVVSSTVGRTNNVGKDSRPKGSTSLPVKLQVRDRPCQMELFRYWGPPISLASSSSNSIKANRCSRHPRGEGSIHQIGPCHGKTTPSRQGKQRRGLVAAKDDQTCRCHHLPGGRHAHFSSGEPPSRTSSSVRVTLAMITAAGCAKQRMSSLPLSNRSPQKLPEFTQGSNRTSLATGHGQTV